MITSPDTRKIRALCLLSFSPAKGIGFYEADGSLHVLDLIAAQDLCIEATVAAYICTLTGEQLEAGLHFDSKQDLLAFVHQEYLRDKKNTYYAELFTRPLSKTRQMKTLRFLNDDSLRGIPVSQTLIPLLKRVFEPQLAAAVISLSTELKLRNVQDCLTTELREIALCDAVVRICKSGRGLTGVRELKHAIPIL